MPPRYLVTGRPCSGKSALAAWLCQRLPGPVAGLRALCTGRCAGGALYAGQDLATGALLPLDRAEEEQVVPHLEGWDDAVAALEAAGQGRAATLLVDMPAPPAACCPRWEQALAALAAGPAALVVAAPTLAPALLGAGTRVLDLDAAAPQAWREQLAPALPAPLRAGVGVRLFREEKCFGPGPVQLLELVGATGSLHQAAAAMGMAYSKAWKMLNQLEAQWGFAMVERRPGGAGGGGSLLTPRAWALLRRYRMLEWACDRAAEQGFRQWFGDFLPGDPTQEV